VETVRFADGITIVASDSKTSAEVYSMVRKLTERVDTHARQIESLTDRARVDSDSETAPRQTLSTPQPLLFRPIAMPAAQAPSKRQKQV
jgi:type IV secretory pathway TraG/TraD family ATPase VirD4